MARVAILGASGMLGCSIMPFLDTQSHEIHCISGPSDPLGLDLSEPAALLVKLGEIRPDIIVNLVALTDVDLCEQRPYDAYKLNTLTAENLSSFVRAYELCHLVHVSTDQVYDGDGPHDESKVRLTNYYAFSKYAAELAVASERTTILRTNFVGKSRSPRRHSFSDWVYSRLAAGEEVTGFSDVLCSPISMATFAELLNKILTELPVGTFNLGASTGASKADIAEALVVRLNKSRTRVRRVNSHDFEQLVAYRPKDMRMIVSRIEARLGLLMPSLDEEIQRVAAEYH